MYINLTAFIKLGGVMAALVICGFGVFKFATAQNINQQIASTLVAMFGLQLGWFLMWVSRK